MPYALHAIYAPNSIVAGYQRGHEIHEDVIAAWGLVEGDDWQADQPDHVPAAAPVIARPVDDSDRGAWVAYAVSQGADPEEVANTDLDVLMDRYGHDKRADDEKHARPVDSAKKSEWVLYVNDHPQATAEDQAWAGDDSTTKAELQSWEPRSGDPVAESATEANQA